MVAVASFLSLVLWLFVIVTLVRVAFSWVSPYPNNPVYRFAVLVTEPVLGPVRRLLPPVSGMDLSPLVVTVACYFLIHALGYVGG
jgi:YggT family protein